MNGLGKRNKVRERGEGGAVVQLGAVSSVAAVVAAVVVASLSWCSSEPSPQHH